MFKIQYRKSKHCMGQSTSKQVFILVLLFMFYVLLLSSSQCLPTFSSCVPEKKSIFNSEKEEKNTRERCVLSRLRI